MNPKENNYAFIDSQNLNLGIKGMGWSLDWKKFRIYLDRKHKITKAYLFLGYIAGNQDLYLSLQKAGFYLIFKPVLIGKNGLIKGNCDAELVLQTMIDFHDYEKAVIVSGDGDFYCLINYLYQQKKLKYVMAPNQKQYSGLLKKSAREKLLFMNNLQQVLRYEKAPHGDKPV